MVFCSPPPLIQPIWDSTNWKVAILLQWSEEEDEHRYVPDIMVMELESQIAELDKAKEDRKR